MEFILTFFIIIIALSWIFVRLLPRILAWYIKRKVGRGETFGGFAGGPFGNGYRQNEAPEEEIKRSKEQEGKVTVIKVEETEKVIEGDMGEYIDFEEEK